MKTYTHLLSYITQFFLEWEIFRTKLVKKIKTYILCSVILPPPPNKVFYEIMWMEW